MAATPPAIAPFTLRLKSIALERNATRACGYSVMVMEEALALLHERIRRRGVNKVIYWATRAVFQPAIHLYFRLRRDRAAA